MLIRWPLLHKQYYTYIYNTTAALCQQLGYTAKVLGKTVELLRISFGKTTFFVKDNSIN